jgi:hypothetical protein
MTIWLPIRKLNVDLFDEPSYKHSIQFPVKLESFFKNTQHVTGWSLDDVLNNHTNWRLYLQCLNPKKAEKLKERILRGNSDNPLRQKEKLVTPNYCPECVQNLISEGGDMYWNRLHQIPNIQICTVHHCYLEQIETHHLIASKYPLHIPSFNLCPQRHGRKCNSIMLQKIAERMVSIVTGDVQLDLNYRQRLTELGYSGYLNKINKTQIHKELNEFYSEDLLKSLGEKSNSIIALLDKNKSDRPITRHILLDYFISNLTSQPPKTKSKFWDLHLFDNAEFRCSDISCKSSDKRLKIVSIYRFDRTRRATCADFECPCGTRFTITFSLTDGRYKPFIRKKPVIPKKERTQPDPKILKSYRKAFIDLFGKRYLSYTLKIKSGNARKWLKRFDLEWFQKKLKILKEAREKQIEISREELDKHNLVKLKEANEKLIKLNKPSRICMRALKKIAKVPRALGPLSHNFVLKNSESLHEFRVRRIKQKVQECISKGEPLTTRNLLLNYSVKTRNELRPFTDELIANHNKY